MILSNTKIVNNSKPYNTSW